MRRWSKHVSSLSFLSTDKKYVYLKRTNVSIPVYIQPTPLKCFSRMGKTLCWVPKHMKQHTNTETTVVVGMEFGDVGCVRESCILCYNFRRISSPIWLQI